MKSIVLGFSKMIRMSVSKWVTVAIWENLFTLWNVLFLGMWQNILSDLANYPNITVHEKLAKVGMNFHFLVSDWKGVQSQTGKSLQLISDHKAMNIQHGE